MDVVTDAAAMMFDSLIVLAFGDFGQAAAQFLQQLEPVTVLSPSPGMKTLPAELDDPAVAAALSSWRPMPDLANQLDARSFATKTPFLSLTTMDQTMCMGPTVVPGTSACWRCWWRRDPLGDAGMHAVQRRSFYADHPASGPRGYLPSLARLGAAQLAQAWAMVKASGGNEGEVIRTKLFGRHITVSRSIGFDGCDRCGLHRDSRTRSYQDLQSSLESLWTIDSQERV